MSRSAALLAIPLAFAALILSAGAAHAVKFRETPSVELRTGKFAPKFMDIGDDDNSFAFERKFDSQCDRETLFGAGWDTIYDSRLEWEGEMIYLTTGGCRFTMPYELSPESLPVLAAAGIPLAEVLYHLEKEPGKLGGGTLVFVSTAPKDDNLPLTIAFDGKSFLGGGGKWEFDSEGYLSRFFSHRVHRDADHRITRLDVQAGQHLDFSRPDERTLTARYSAHPKNELVYRFDDEGNLRSVKNIWGNTYRYDYDSSGRLTSMVWPDRTNATVLYDEKHNRVLFYKDRDGCIEQYFYNWNGARRYLTGETVKFCADSTKPTAHDHFIMRFFDEEFEKVSSIQRIRDLVQAEEATVSTDFYDEFGNRVYWSGSRSSGEVEPEGGAGWYFPETGKAFSGSEEVILYKWESTWSGVLEVLNKGGDRQELAKTSYLTDMYLSEQAKLPKSIQGFFSYEGYYNVGAVEDLAYDTDQGIAVDHGRVTAIKRRGVWYALTFDDGGYARIAVGDEGKPLTLDEQKKALPQEGYKALLEALEFGGLLLRTWTTVGFREAPK